ncbi:hypothetical protein Tco_0814316 [Tanacetum coccineum]
MGNDSLRSSSRRGAQARGVVPGIKLIWNSTWRTGGRPVLGQMAHRVASITLDSARSYVMQSAFLTQGIVSTVVGVDVTVVVVVESSYVVKLLFMIT